MRFACALLAVAACSGTGTGPTNPKERPVLRLVRCVPAVAPIVAPPAPRESRRDSRWEQKLRRVQVGLTEAHGGGVILASAGWGQHPGTVSLGTVASDGGLTPEQLATVLRTKLPALTRCLQDDLDAGSGMLKSIVQWKIAIDATGHVTAATTSANPTTPALKSCVSTVLTSAVFPASGTALTATVPLIFDASGAPVVAAKPVPAPPEDDELIERAAWTPYATSATVPAQVATTAQATATAVTSALPELDKCFPAPAPSGSLRAMLTIDIGGDVASLRLGGLGDKPSEDCMAKVLQKLHVVTPASETFEIACDLSRGDAHPWRVTPAANYGVITATKDKLTYDGQTITAGPTPPEPIQDSKLFLVVAEPDTPGKLLTLAQQWGNDGEGVVFALKDGAAPPLYLGVANTTVTQGEVTDDAIQPTIRVSGKEVVGCVHRATKPAKVSDGRAIGQIANQIAAKCKQLTCATTLIIAIDPDAVTRDLVEVTGAARRAGFDRVLLGGEAGCQPPKPGSGMDFRGGGGQGEGFGKE